MGLFNSAPDKIAKPSLHQHWDQIKEKAKQTAIALDKRNKDSEKTQQKAWEHLDKVAFRKDLGKNLDRWCGLYPDFPKMESLLHHTLEPTIKAYIGALHHSEIDPHIKSHLEHTLKELLHEQEHRRALAERIIASDTSLAVKDSKKKAAPPIVVFKHHDVLDLALKKAHSLENIDVKGHLPLEVIIGDTAILSKFGGDKDFANEAQKIKDAGDFSKIVEHVAHAIKQADIAVGKGKSKAAQEKMILKEFDEAIRQGVERATKEAGRLAGIKGNARWAHVKRGIGLTLSFGGVAAGVASLALAPFTLGVSTAATCLILAKNTVAVGQQLSAIVLTAEEQANLCAKGLHDLKKAYDKWLSDPEVKRAGGVSNKVGMAELAKRGINAVAPTWINTIKSVKGGVENYLVKINNLEIKANAMADDFGKLLSDQKKLTQIYDGVKHKASEALPEKDARAIQHLESLVKQSEREVDGLIKSVTELNQRVSKNRATMHKLEHELHGVSSKNPLWSDLGAATFELGASVALAFASGVKAPEPFEAVKEAKEIIEKANKVREHIAQVYEMAESLKEAAEEQKHRFKE